MTFLSFFGEALFAYQGTLYNLVFLVNVYSPCSFSISSPVHAINSPVSRKFHEAYGNPHVKCVTKFILGTQVLSKQSSVSAAGFKKAGLVSTESLIPKRSQLIVYQTQHLVETTITKTCCENQVRPLEKMGT